MSGHTLLVCSVIAWAEVEKNPRFVKRSFFFCLRVSLDRACTSRNHFFSVCVSMDFHESWHGHNDCLFFTEVKQQWAMLVLGWVTASVHYSCLRWLCTRARGPKHFSAVFFLSLDFHELWQSVQVCSMKLSGNGLC